jgi:hypothetical protein
MAVNLLYIPTSLRPFNLPRVEEVRPEKVPGELWAADLPDHKPPFVEPVGDLELLPLWTWHDLLGPLEAVVHDLLVVNPREKLWELGSVLPDIPEMFATSLSAPNDEELKHPTGLVQIVM